MDDQVTGTAPKPEEKTPEEIRREMEQTRESITQKVAALEQTVTGNIHAVTRTVEHVKTAVADTVSTVKDSLRESVHTVADTVKETFDVSAHVRANPWAAVGVAAGCGFITGLLLGGDRQHARVAEKMPEASAREPAPVSARREPQKPDFLDEMFGMVGREFKQVVETALSSALAALKRNVSEAVPGLVDTAVAEVVPTGRGATGNGVERAGYAARG